MFMHQACLLQNVGRVVVAGKSIVGIVAVMFVEAVCQRSCSSFCNASEIVLPERRQLANAVIECIGCPDYGEQAPRRRPHRCVCS